MMKDRSKSMFRFSGLFLVTLLFCMPATRAQSTREDSLIMKKVIKAHAETMGNLFINLDFEHFMDFMYPGLIQLSGGKDKMKETLQKVADRVKAQNIAFVSISFSEPSLIVQNGNELQCIMVETLNLTEANANTVQTKGLVVAISQDDGRRWSFMDVPRKDIKALFPAFPNLSPALENSSLQLMKEEGVEIEPK